MAVELLIKNRDTGASELVPVATTEVFHQFWVKGCAQLDLRLVPRFEDGITDFSPDEIRVVIDELRQLRSWFQQTQVPQNAKALGVRVDNTIRAFERVLADSRLSIG